MNAKVILPETVPNDPWEEGVSAVVRCQDCGEILSGGEPVSPADPGCRKVFRIPSADQTVEILFKGNDLVKISSSGDGSFSSEYVYPEDLKKAGVCPLCGGVIKGPYETGYGIGICFCVNAGCRFITVK